MFCNASSIILHLRPTWKCTCTLYNQHGDLLIFTKSWIIFRIIVTIIDLSWECPGNKMPSQKCPRIVHPYVIVFLIANLSLLIPGTIDFFVCVNMMLLLKFTKYPIIFRNVCSLEIGTGKSFLEALILESTNP